MCGERKCALRNSAASRGEDRALSSLTCKDINDFISSSLRLPGCLCPSQITLKASHFACLLCLLATHRKGPCTVQMQGMLGIFQSFLHITSGSRWPGFVPDVESSEKHMYGQQATCEECLCCALNDGILYAVLVQGTLLLPELLAGVTDSTNWAHFFPNVSIHQKSCAHQHVAGNT